MEEGIPEEWLRPGSRRKVRNMSADYGLVSDPAFVDGDGKGHLDYKGPENV